MLYNLKTQRLETLSDDGTQLLPLKSLPRFYYQSTTTFEIQLIDGLPEIGAPHYIPIQANTLCYLTIDNQWNHEASPILEATCNTTSSPLSRFEIQTNTTRFKDAIEGTDCIFAICEFTIPTTDPKYQTVIGSFKIELHNRLHVSGTPTPSLEIEYPIEAPSDSKLYGRKNKSWFELQFSKGLSVVHCDTLPEEGIDGTLYIVKNPNLSLAYKNVYMWSKNAFELIGVTSVSDFYSKAEMEQLLENKLNIDSISSGRNILVEQTGANVSIHADGLATKEYVDELIGNISLSIDSINGEAI